MLCAEVNGQEKPFVYNFKYAPLFEPYMSDSSGSPRLKPQPEKESLAGSCTDSSTESIQFQLPAQGC